MPRQALPLSESHPDVAARWMANLEVSDVRTPAEFSISARLRCWWWCGKSGHAWFDAPPGEHRHTFHCPQCRADRWAEHEQIMASPVADVPALVEAWQDDRLYTGLRVRDLCTGVQGKNFGQTYTLRCPKGHKLDTMVGPFVLSGCPYCRGKQTRDTTQSTSIAEGDPEVTATWHPTFNGDRTPDNTTTRHRDPIWWKSVQCCGFEW